MKKSLQASCVGDKRGVPVDFSIKNVINWLSRKIIGKIWRLQWITKQTIQDG